MNEQRTFTQRAGIVVAMVTAVLVVGWLILNTIGVLLVVFAGFLLAIFLTALTTMIASHTALSYRWSFGIMLLLIVLLFTTFGFAIAPVIGSQINELQSTLPDAVDRFQETVSTWPLGEQLLQQTPQPEEMLNSQSIFGRVSGIFSVTFGMLTNMVIVLFVGLYGAFNPHLYRDGLVRLFPIAKRPRVLEVLAKLGGALRQWLLGQSIAMTIIGVTTTLALWFLDIPLALLLGFIAAILTFIPNIGPFLSAVPAVLLGLVQSPTKALYVILAYVIIQTIESYFVTPMIQRKMIELPPAVMIVVQVALGILWGIVGLFVATPLAVAVIVLIQMIYVNDVLKDDMPVYGEHHHDEDDSET